ncbi:MAG: hypothetical protein JNK72_02880 [Myxococcales bacterium]|nr:hypothetical protein [Myxococcales bacterium]
MAPLSKAPQKKRRQRGAAYTETVVMLPFFIAVWTCMIYVHKAYSTKVHTMAYNRNCVMSYAFEACRTQAPGCSNRASPHTDAGERPGDLNGLQSMLGGLGNSLFGALMGQTTELRTTRNVAKPRLLGGGNTQALAGNSMMCNTERTTPASVFRQAFCSFIGIC